MPSCSERSFEAQQQQQRQRQRQQQGDFAELQGERSMTFNQNILTNRNRNAAHLTASLRSPAVFTGDSPHLELLLNNHESTVGEDDGAAMPIDMGNESLVSLISQGVSHGTQDAVNRHFFTLALADVAAAAVASPAPEHDYHRHHLTNVQSLFFDSALHPSKVIDTASIALECALQMLDDDEEEPVLDDGSMMLSWLHDQPRSNAESEAMLTTSSEPNGPEHSTTEETMICPPTANKDDDMKQD